MEKLFVPLMFLVCTILIISILFIVVGTKHKERMAMIQKGMNPDQFPQKTNMRENLKWGMFLVSIGLGFLIAFILDRFVFVSMEETEPLFPSLVAIFGGLSLILYYWLFNNK